MFIFAPKEVAVSLSHWGLFDLSGSDVLRIVKARSMAAYEARFGLQAGC
jgi:hypothetical protein